MQHIVGKLSMKAITFFRPHLSKKSARKIMVPQSRESPHFGNFGTLRTKFHLDVGPMGSHKLYYKGEGGGFPQVRAVVSFVNLSCSWFILAPKVFQLCTNHLMLVLCRSVWVACQFFLVPSWGSSTPLHPSKVLRTRECALTPCSSVVFCLRFTFESLKELERVRNIIINLKVYSQYLKTNLRGWQVPMLANVFVFFHNIKGEKLGKREILICMNLFLVWHRGSNNF